jgi:hypothetical protein
MTPDGARFLTGFHYRLTFNALFLMGLIPVFEFWRKPVIQEADVTSRCFGASAAANLINPHFTKSIACLLQRKS